MKHLSVIKEATFYQRHPIWSTLIIEIVFYLLTTLLLPAIIPALRSNPVYITNFYAEQETETSTTSESQTIQILQNNVNNERLALVRVLIFLLAIIEAIIISSIIYVKCFSDIPQKDENTLTIFLMLCLILSFCPLLYTILDLYDKIRAWAPAIVP